MFMRMRLTEWLVVLSFWAVPSQLFASAYFGHAQRQSDLLGETSWTETGNVSKNFEIFLICLFTLLIFVYLFQKSKPAQLGLARSTVWLAVTGFTLLFSLLVNFNSWPIAAILRILIFGFLIFVVRREGLTRQFTRVLAKNAAVLVLVSLVFIFLDPSYASAPCRLDKCSPLGLLYNSFYPHQNYLALVMLSVLPLLFTLENRRIRYSSVAINLLLIVATGARVAYLAVLVLSILYISKLKRWGSLIPALGVLFSLFIFVVTKGDDLTGRGYIYQVIKDNFAKHGIFGYGPNALADAYQSSSISFLAYHDHGAAPSLIDRYGLLVFVGVFATLLAFGVALAKRHKSLQMSKLYPLIALAFTFGSETSLQIDFLSLSAWAVYLFISATRDQELSEQSAQSL